jgi:hypothetical protein
MSERDMAEKDTTGSLASHPLTEKARPYFGMLTSVPNGSACAAQSCGAADLMSPTAGDRTGTV